MTSDAKPIEFERDGETWRLRVFSYEKNGGTADFDATPEDIAAAGYVPASALQSAKGRIAELEADARSVSAFATETADMERRALVAERRVAELGADVHAERTQKDALRVTLEALTARVASLAHLEEAAELLRGCCRRNHEVPEAWEQDEIDVLNTAINAWYARDQALQAKPSPANPHHGSPLESAFTAKEWSEIQAQVKPSPVIPRQCNSCGGSGSSPASGDCLACGGSGAAQVVSMQSPAGEKEPERCPRCSHFLSSHADGFCKLCECGGYIEAVRKAASNYGKPASPPVPAAAGEPWVPRFGGVVRLKASPAEFTVRSVDDSDKTALITGGSGLAMWRNWDDIEPAPSSPPQPDSGQGAVEKLRRDLADLLIRVVDDVNGGPAAHAFRRLADELERLGSE
jgi:hypothetical protein